MSFARPLVLLPILTAFAGCVFGLVHFAVLRHSLVMPAPGRRRHGLIPLALLRLAIATVFFSLVARLGALALLVALGGFLSARALALRAASKSG
jgi:hypothetical protein